MNKFKKISINKFELKGKPVSISSDKMKGINGGNLIGVNDPCLP